MAIRIRQMNLNSFAVSLGDRVQLWCDDRAQPTLPHQSHGYRARESVMQIAWEMTARLDKYVKDAAPPDKREQALKLWE